MGFTQDQFQKDIVKELQSMRKNMEVMAKAAVVLEKAERVKLGLSPISKEFPECRSEKLDDIIAIDFDGTLVENAFPEIGAPIWPVIEYVKHRQRKGARLILWTSRCGEKLDEAVAWCAENGIVLSAINENLPEIIDAFGGDCRKIFANEYIDDRAVLPSQLMWKELHREK
jgi:hypothetical protein